MTVNRHDLKLPASSVALNFTFNPLLPVIEKLYFFPISYSQGWLDSVTHVTVGGTSLLSVTSMRSKLTSA